MGRSKTLLAVCFALAAFAMPGTGTADPWKNESGKGRDRREFGWEHRGDRRDGPRWERQEDRRHRDRWDDRRGYEARPRIPSGHLPPPGEYRLWYPDRPPGHQPPPGRW